MTASGMKRPRGAGSPVAQKRKISSAKGASSGLHSTWLCLRRKWQSGSRRSSISSSRVEVLRSSPSAPISLK